MDQLDTTLPIQFQGGTAQDQQPISPTQCKRRQQTVYIVDGNNTHAGPSQPQLVKLTWSMLGGALRIRDGVEVMFCGKEVIDEGWSLSRAFQLV